MILGGKEDTCNGWDPGGGRGGGSGWVWVGLQGAMDGPTRNHGWHPPLTSGPR